MTSRQLFSVILCASVVPVGDIHGQDADSVKERALTDWEAVVGMIATVRRKETKETYRSQGREPLSLKRTDEIRFDVSKHHLQFSYDVVEGGVRAPDGKTTLINPRYTAELAKSPKSGAWLLMKHESLAAPDATDRRTVLLPWTVMANVNMWDWLRDGRVVVGRVERPAGSSPPLRMHFVFDGTSTRPGKHQEDTTLRSGSIDFDDTDRHKILGYQITRKTQFSDWVEIGTFEYTASSHGIPVLKRVVIDSPEMKSERFGLRGIREISTYQIEYNGDLPEEIFWLSHYGLPEPVGVELPAKPTPRYVWFLAATGVFVLLMVVFRWLARRRAAKVPV